ncbi:hypothetical protein LTR50_005155 [Elasticomyces elasticus]|nr:hypothetical protein LTR50_005155 [Elasticomyces elasticus]
MRQCAPADQQACLQACLKNGGLRKKQLKQRATLTCSSSETCFQYTDMSLLCLDMTTGNYHDDAGGKGNYNTGVYTASNGVVQTGTSAPTSTSRRSSGSAATTTVASLSTSRTGTATVTSAIAASVSAASVSAASVSTASVSAASSKSTVSRSTASASAASATATASPVLSTTSAGNSAVGKLGAGAVVALLGLVAGLVW